MSKRERWGTGKGLRQGSVLGAATYRCLASALPKDAQPRGQVGAEVQPVPGPGGQGGMREGGLH